MEISLIFAILIALGAIGFLLLPAFTKVRGDMVCWLRRKGVLGWLARHHIFSERGWHPHLPGRCDCK